MPNESGALHQMVFTSPEGRREALWVEDHSHHTYRVLSVPIWVYGISVGTIVTAQQSDDLGFELQFDTVVAISPRGTIRFIVAPGMRAKQVYIDRVLPDAAHLNLFVGPATFLHPRVVAMSLYQRDKWWPDVGSYLDDLVRQDVLEQWEVADPDAHASESAPAPVDPQPKILVHQLPVDGALGQEAS